LRASILEGGGIVGRLKDLEIRSLVLCSRGRIAYVIAEFGIRMRKLWQNALLRRVAESALGDRYGGTKKRPDAA
jgi:hypothetical protein